MQIVTSLPSVWEAWTKSQLTALAWPSSGCCRYVGERTSRWKSSFCLKISKTREKAREAVRTGVCTQRLRSDGQIWNEFSRCLRDTQGL